MVKRFVEGASILCLVLALAATALASNTHVEGSVRDAIGRSMDYGLGIEAVWDDTCHYGAATDDVPDTLDWPRHALLFGPASWPIGLCVNWKVEATMTFGWVQFKEITAATSGPAAYTWGDPLRVDIALLANANPKQDHEFKVGLWESVRVWAQGSADGLCSISVHAPTLE